MKFRIVDLHGTLLKLQADWQAIRALVAAQMRPLEYDALIGLDRNIFRIRKHDPARYAKVLEEVSRLEQMGLLFAPTNTVLIEELRAMPWAMFTANARATAQAALALPSLSGLTPRMIVSKEDVSEPKPSGEGALKILKQLGWDPAEVLYIGDSDMDEMSAKEAGVNFRRVNSF